jgi:hypothetical protein
LVERSDYRQLAALGNRDIACPPPSRGSLGAKATLRLEMSLLIGRRPLGPLFGPILHNAGSKPSWCGSPSGDDGLAIAEQIDL